MKINSLSNIQFKGFDNICTAADIPVGTKRVSYIACHLNDDGADDLSKYNELRRMQGYTHDFQKKDVVVITYIKDLKNNSDHILLGDKDMYWGDELMQLKDKFVPKEISEAKYEKIEALHLKAYTFLANLTKRLMNHQFENEDINYRKVIKETYDIFSALHINCLPVFSPSEAYKLVEIGCLKTFSFQKLASSFNKGIDHTMKHFFNVL